MKSDFDFNLDEFTEALRQYVDFTQKDVAEVINKKAKDVCFFAAKRTKQASAGDINQYSPNARDRTKAKVLHSLAATGKTKFGKAVKGQGNKEVALKIFASRKSASGYSRAIWYRIAKDFGAKLRGKFNLDHASGEKAKPGVKPTAWLNADGLEISQISNVLQSALEAGMRDAAKDMDAYIQRKMAARAAQHSAR